LIVWVMCRMANKLYLQALAFALSGKGLSRGLPCKQPIQTP